MIDRLAANPLTTSDVQDFSARGFLVMDEFLDDRAVQELISEVESLETDAETSSIRRGVAFARRNLLKLNFVQAFITKPQVRELINEIGPNLVAVRAILFDKTGSANWTVPWHQDRSIAVQERLDVPGFGPWSTKAGVVHVQPPLEILRRIVTLRFHLDACGPDNGPLRVIGETQHRILSQSEIEDCIANTKDISCTVRAGGLLMMRPLVLHASSPARNASHRRVIHVEFAPAELPAGLRWAMCCS